MTQVPICLHSDPNKVIGNIHIKQDAEFYDACTQKRMALENIVRVEVDRFYPGKHEVCLMALVVIDKDGNYGYLRSDHCDQIPEVC